MHRLCCFLLLVIAFFIGNQSAVAAEVNTTNYDIYIGDLNGDGGKDFFFKSKPFTLILHGDVATPIVFYKNMDFAVYRNGNSYSSPVGYSLSPDDIKARLANGSLVLAQSNSDYVVWSNGVAGRTNILLRGTDASSPALMLVTTADAALPLSARVLLPQNYPGISDRTVELSLKDINYDGRLDLILEDKATNAKWKMAYLADASELPVIARELRPSSVSPTFANNLLVGSTSAQFRVDESGAATYSVPITLPDGVAGVKPQVSLDYSSNGGNGIAGQGWSLSGVSAVTRCRQTLSQDGVSVPITWSASDRFCYNGQRLMVVSGSYGAPESTYRTEIDSFVVVTAKGGSIGHPDYFTVAAKDGSMSYFGNTTNSKLSGSATNTTLTWSINRFSDNVGNKIDFVYEGSASTGQVLKNIYYAYAGKPNAEGAARAQVIFEYVSREDKSFAYVAGQKFQQTQLLRRITVKSDGAILRTYDLGYMPVDANTIRYQNKSNHLEAIQECNSGACLPALSFKWGGGSRVSFPPENRRDYQTASSSDTTNILLQNLFADLDGDGKQDIAYVMRGAAGAQTWITVWYQYASASAPGYIPSFLVNDISDVRLVNLDFNADGRQDLALYANGVWTFYIAKADSSGGWTGFSELPQPTLTDPKTMFADLNGDGLVDAVTASGYRLLKPSNTEPITSAQYYSFANYIPLAVATSEIPGLNDAAEYCVARNSSINIDPASFADFNGDGVVDFIGDLHVTNTRKSSEECSRSTSVTVQHPTLDYRIAFTIRDNVIRYVGQLSDGTNSYGSSYTADVNGDGSSEIISSKKATPNTYSVSFSSSWSAENFTIDADTTTPPRLQFVDINNDGLLDIVWYRKSDSSLRAILRDPVGGYGNSTTTPIVGNLVVSTITNAAATDSHMLADISGDGAFDYVYIGEKKISVYSGVRKAGTANMVCHAFAVPIPGTACVDGINAETTVPDSESPNAILSINNGLDNITKITYGTLANSGHYATLKIDPTVTSATVNRDCSAYEQYGKTSEQYLRCMGSTGSDTYTYVDNSAFYKFLNGGWNLPAGSVLLQPDKSISATNNTKGSPVLEVNGSMSIVTQVSSSAPLPNNTEALSSVEYYYAEAKMQALGRGFLGFALLKTFDSQSKVATINRYRQDFPFIGSPLSTEVYSGERLLSQAVNTWQVKVGEASGIYQPYIASATEKSYALNSGAHLQTVVSSIEMDSTPYGNPKKLTTKTSNAGDTQSFVQTTDNIYSLDPWAARLGRLAQTTVSTSKNGVSDPETTRTVNFDYYLAGAFIGMLEKEIVAKGDANNELVTIYSYDDWGNKKSVATSGKNALGVVETRTVSNDYTGSDGRYLGSSSNDLSQASTITARNEYGQAKIVKDTNQVESSIYYDAFGREYMRTDATGAWVRTETNFCVSGCPSGAKYFTTTRVSGGGSSTDYFDKLGRVIQSSKVGFDGRVIYISTEYDNLSRVARQSTPYFAGETPTGWTVTAYDTLGRVTKITPPSNDVTNFTSTEYKDFDTVITNAKKQTRTETRNWMGQLVQVKDYLDGTITYDYSTKGSLLSATTTADGKSVTVRMCYDLLGRKIGMLDPDKGGFRATVINCAGFNPATPPVGWWSYQYDAFGELIKQIDPKGQTVAMTYDLLGRMLTRTNKTTGGSIDNFTRWYYETDENGVAQTGAKGKSTVVINNTDGSQKCNSSSVCNYFYYDDKARPISSIKFYPNDSTGYITSTLYDDFGRAYEQRDPMNGAVLGVSGTTARYNAYGYAYDTIDLYDGQSVEQILTTNARGQVLTSVRGNGAVTTNTYDSYTGALETQYAVVFGQPIQSNTYKWDVLGNLKSRQNQSAMVGGTGNKNLSESFEYDGLNRLIKTNSAIAPAGTCNNNTQDISYDGHGNITCKNGVGTYAYGVNAGPHAVTSTTSTGSYTYDYNGNQVGGAGRTLIYTSDDNVTSISNATGTTSFKYGADRARWQRTDSKTQTTTTYIGNIERIQTGSSIEWKRYVGDIIYTYKTNTVNGNNILANTDKRFVYNDHLGSVDVITDALGKVSHSLSFDPWGARRNGESWASLSDTQRVAALKIDAGTTFTREVTLRGFTGHEMLDDMGIIHMNGRIYDQKLARFLQADPYIQAATSTQSYNRYSYVLNNPLNKIDPSGFTWLDNQYKNFMKSNGQWQTHKYLNNHAPRIIPLIQTGLNFIPAIGWILSAAFGANNAFYVSGGQLSAGVRPFVTSVISHYASSVIGGAGSSYATNVFASAMLGGVLSSIQGGSFGNGFASAGLSAILGGSSGGEFSWQGAICDVIVGGTVSELTGGKFANGARTAAMNYAMQWAASEIRAGGLDRARTSESLGNDGDGTRKLFKGCISGDGASCDALKIQNQADLRDAYAFIKAHYPDIVDGIGGPFSQGSLDDIEFVYTKKFADERGGHTDHISGRITLSAAYTTRGDLVNSLAHELMHSSDGLVGRTHTAWQDLIAGKNGARHIYIGEVAANAEAFYNQKFYHHN